MNPHPENPSSNGQRQPSGWVASLASLASSRVGIIQIELQQALRDRSRAVVALITAAVCGVFTWALLLAGGIAALAAATGWAWHLLTLAAAGLHLIAALVLLKMAKAPKPRAFTVTRSEFQKDREWIESLQNNNSRS